AIGAFVSMTPLLGVQTLLAVVGAALLRASIPAAVVGTFFGNPLSWPFIWGSTYVMGLQMTGLPAVFDPAGLERNATLIWHAVVERSPQLLEAATNLLWPLLIPM